MDNQWEDMEWIECSYSTADSQWHEMDVDTAQRVVDCVNQHDSLVAEVERLKQERDSQQRCAIDAMQENEKLKEALKTLVTEIDVIEFLEDLAISEEAYSTAVGLIK